MRIMTENDDVQDVFSPGKMIPSTVIQTRYAQLLFIINRYLKVLSRMIKLGEKGIMGKIWIGVSL